MPSLPVTSNRSSRVAALLGVGLAAALLSALSVPQVRALIGGQTGGSPASGSGHSVRQSFADGSGLVAWWKLDGNANDSSSQGNNGTLNNFNFNATDGYVPGKFSSALKLDGTDDYVSTASLNLNLTSNFTVSVWVNIAAWNGSRMSIFSQAGQASNFALEVGSVSPYTNTIIANSMLNAYYAVSANNVLTTGQWEHIVYVKAANGSNAIYVNGAATALQVNAGAGFNSSTSTKQIGQRGDSSQYFNGTIDDLRIYNRALSAAEVTQLYQGSQPPVCDQTCGGYWKLDESGGHGSDNGTLKNGTANSPAADGTANGPVWSSGQFGNGLTFDGSNDYVDAGAGSPLDITTGDFTLSAWVKTTAAPSTAEIVAKQNGSTAGYGMYLNSGMLGAGLSTGSASVWTTAGTSAIDDGAWHHVVATFQRSGNMVEYVDGVANGTPSSLSTVTASISTTDHVVIGAESDGSTPFGGSIDDVRIYNRALTAAEVNRLYKGTESSVLDSSLAGWWRFDETTGTAASDSSDFAADSSSNGNIGTLTGFSFNGTDGWTSGVYGNGLYFNGTNENVSLGTLSGVDFTKDYTISMWVNLDRIGDPLDDCGDQRAILFIKESGFNPIAIGDYGNGNIFYFRVATSSGGMSVGVAASTGTWYHLVATNSTATSTISIYLNGKKSSSGSYAGSTLLGNASNTAYLNGHDNNCSSTSTLGKIDDVRIYSRALTDYEIYDQYLAGRSM